VAIPEDPKVEPQERLWDGISPRRHGKEKTPESVRNAERGTDRGLGTSRMWTSRAPCAEGARTLRELVCIRLSDAAVASGQTLKRRPKLKRGASGAKHAWTADCEEYPGSLKRLQGES
jgi:hypothetical protein